MTSAQATEALPAPSARPARARQSVIGWHRLRLLLIAGWLLLAAGALGLGERTASFQELETRVASGEVHEVTVVGDTLEPASQGYATVEVHWREGLVRHVATLITAQPRRAAPNRNARDGATVITGNVADRLRASQPGLRVESADGYPSSTSYLGLRVPTWVIWVGSGLSLVTLCLLVLGPEPWRATRWAWFWLLGIGFPLGMIAFLVLSGPTPLPPPRRTSRRFTGGWAFLLMLVLSNLGRAG
ncbi:MAG: hypothetical protein JWN22_1432 [Nocardioides sp.]|nr:hypothetical protein [Nocardioides sp.]